MTAVSMVVIAGIVQVYEGDITNALPAIFAVFMMVGLMQVFLGVLKLGKYIKYIPYPVVSEFMTGIGVIILITQLLTAIGYYPTEDTQFVKKFRPVAKEVILKSILENEIDDQLLVLKNFEVTIEKARNVTTEQLLTESKTLAKKDSSGVLGALRTVPVAIQNINGLELGLNIIIIFITFGFKRITTTIPSTLVVLLGVSIAVYVIDLEVRTIGEIPTGFSMPNFDIITGFIFSATSPYVFTPLILAFLGAIDSLLTSVVADNMTKIKHNPNKELIG